MKSNFCEFYFHAVKNFACVFHVSKLLTSISRPFHVRIVLSLSSMLHSVENLVIVCCFTDCSTYVSGKIHTAKVLQINTIHEYHENIKLNI